MNPWDIQITLEQWQGFLSHDFANRSRATAFAEIDAERKTIDHEPVTVLEIGFGQCYDYANYFKPLQDKGKVKYFGLDVTEQFVVYANQTYGEYFGKGTFNDIVGEYDITYTRHTLEHQDPKEWEPDLRAMLTATRHLAVITWFIPPGKDARYHWAENQWLGQGAWVNQLSEAEVMHVINELGFWAMSIPSEQNNKVYLCRKRVK